eukprot:scpid12130/ scgid0467/ Probable G-protein coupled receptor 112
MTMSGPIDGWPCGDDSDVRFTPAMADHCDGNIGPKPPGASCGKDGFGRISRAFGGQPLALAALIAVYLIVLSTLTAAQTTPPPAGPLAGPCSFPNSLRFRDAPGYCYSQPTNATLSYAEADAECRGRGMEVLYFSGAAEFDLFRNSGRLTADAFRTPGRTFWTSLRKDAVLSVTSLTWLTDGGDALNTSWLSVPDVGNTILAAEPSPFRAPFMDGLCVEIVLTSESGMVLAGLNDLPCTESRGVLCKSDVDECNITANPFPCPDKDGEICVNTPGAFFCKPFCKVACGDASCGLDAIGNWTCFCNDSAQVYNASLRTCHCGTMQLESIVEETERLICIIKQNTTSTTTLMTFLSNETASSEEILSALRGALSDPINLTARTVEQAIQRLVNLSYFDSNFTAWNNLGNQLLDFGTNLLFLGGKDEAVITQPPSAGTGLSFGLFTLHLTEPHDSTLCLDYTTDGTGMVTISQGNGLPGTADTIAICQAPSLNMARAPTASFLYESRFPRNAEALLSTQCNSDDLVPAFVGHVTVAGAASMAFRSNTFGVSRICAEFNYTTSCYQLLNEVNFPLRRGSVHRCNATNAGTYTLLSRLIDDSQNEESVNMVINRLRAPGANITDQLLEDAVSVLDNIQHPTQSEMVAEAVVSIVNLLASAPESVLSTASETNTSQRLLVSLQNYNGRVLIAVGSEKVYSGRAYSSLTRSVDSAAISDTRLTSHGVDGMLTGEGIEVSLPEGLVRRGVGNIEDGEDAGSVQIQFSIFSGKALNFFRDPNEVRDMSAVAAIAVGARDIDDAADTPVTITFTISRDIRNATCAFWDIGANDGLGGWSSRGCYLMSISNSSNTSAGGGVNVSCQCEHLTHFAILFSSTAATSNTQPLEIITYIGAGINAVILIFLIVTIVAFRKLRREIRLRLLIQLFLCYVVMATILMLLPLANDTRDSCIAASVLLHFFVMAALAWSSVEAFHLYRTLITVFAKEVRFYFAKCCIAGWGLPALIVFINLAVGEFKLDNYVNADDSGNLPSDYRCFLTTLPNRNHYYYPFILPMCLFLAFNVAVFVRLVYVIRKTQTSDGKGIKHWRRQLLTSISIATLVGLNWLLTIGLLVDADGHTNIVSVYIFSIVMALFGVVMFIIHVLLRKEIRQAWSRHPVYTGLRSRLSTAGSFLTPATSKGRTTSTSSSNGGASGSSKSDGDKSGADRSSVINASSPTSEKPSKVMWIGMDERGNAKSPDSTTVADNETDDHKLNYMNSGARPSDVSKPGLRGNKEPRRGSAPGVVVRGTRSPPSTLQVPGGDRDSSSGDASRFSSTEKLVSPHRSSTNIPM